MDRILLSTHPVQLSFRYNDYCDLASEIVINHDAIIKSTHDHWRTLLENCGNRSQVKIESRSNKVYVISNSVRSIWYNGYIEWLHSYVTSRMIDCATCQQIFARRNCLMAWTKVKQLCWTSWYLGRVAIFLIRSLVAI